MSARFLTPLQQSRIQKKIFKLLSTLGFQQEKDYWWFKANTDTRICIGFDVKDQCLGGRTSWCWQTAPLDKEPLFGYSGTTHVGASYGTVERIMEITFNHFYYVGCRVGRETEGEKRKKLKEALNTALTNDY